MSFTRKTLKILALIYFVLGIASLVTAGVGIATGGLDSTYGSYATLAAVVLIAKGLVDLAAGVAGIKGANKPSQVDGAFKLGIVAAVATLAQAVLTLPAFGGDAINFGAFVIVVYDLFFVQQAHAVKAENKHVILISDGATYLYCKNSDYTKPYTRSFGDPTKQTNPVTGAAYPYGSNKMGGIWEWQSREYNFNNAWKKFPDGSNFIFSQAMKSPEKLGEYLAYYRGQYENSDKNWAQYDYEYTDAAANNGTTNPIPVDVNAPCNIDVAFWSTDDTFQSMVKAGYDMNVYYKNAADFDGQVFLQYLVRNSNNGELNTDFDKLKAKLVDKIAAGSTVEDTIGANFDFVNDPAKISLTANDEKLSPEKIDATTYGFGKKSDGTYRFTLKYQAGENEKLILTLNEAAAPSRPVALEYSELLVNKPTEPGTHTLKVNESAVLHPIDGNGVAGEAYEFPVPTVDYTVAKPDPAPQPGATDKPSDNGAATDKPGAKTALAKTGDEAFAIGMGCLLVAGASACVIATALKRRRN